MTVFAPIVSATIGTVPHVPSGQRRRSDLFESSDDNILTLGDPYRVIDRLSAMSNRGHGRRRSIGSCPTQVVRKSLRLRRNTGAKFQNSFKKLKKLDIIPPSQKVPDSVSGFTRGRDYST
jgi:hypothetical protein